MSNEIENKLDAIEKNLLKTIADIEKTPIGAYNIRENGKGVARNTTANIDIVTKQDKPGIDIIIKPNTKNESVHIPVILTEAGFNDVVYNDFYVGELDYGNGKLNIGSMICYDREFPESSRILMIKGAEIILVPNACFMSKIRLEQLKIRAYENMVGIVTVNYTDYGGRSSAFSPIVRDENKKELNSEILIMDENESIQIVEFNMDEIRNYREHGTWGDSYRKPFLYEYISQEHVKEPFIRMDARRNTKKYIEQ